MRRVLKALFGKCEDAEKEAKIRKTLGYFIAFSAVGMITASIGPFLPGFAKQTGSDVSNISFLLSARSFGFLIGTAKLGKIYDKNRGHPIITGALALLAMSLVAAPFIPWLWLLTFDVFLIGAAQGIITVGSNTLIVWTNPHRAGPVMSGLHFFFGIGALTAPIIVAQSLKHSGTIDYSLWILALLMIPPALWLLFQRSPKISREEDSSEYKPVNYFLLTFILLFFFFYVGAEGGVAYWLFSYALDTGLVDEQAAALINSAYWGSFTFGRLIAIPAAARMLPKRILVIALSGAILSAGLILLFLDSLIILWIGTILLGFFMAPVFPVMFSFAERRIHLSGQVTGWFFGAASAGAMTLPFIMGQTFQFIGSYTVILSILIILAIVLSVLSVLIVYSDRYMPDS